jgi:ribosomal protein S18 acetylase RimI-like enzyme
MGTGSDARLLDAVADNHRVWFERSTRTAGLRPLRVGGTTLYPGSEAMVFPDGEIELDALVAELRTGAHRGAGVWSLDFDRLLGARLLARGFGWGWRPHWMAARTEPAAAGACERFAGAPERFAVERASAPYARTLPYAPEGPEPPEAFRLGVRLRDKVVGSVVVNPHDGVAGLYSMGVAPRVRRRGIGSALTRAACRLAHERGCGEAVLNATAEGTLLYERVGFRSLGWGQTWWWSPAPAPTERQLELAEAVGFGGLERLEELGLAQAELQAPLPCGVSPLAIAVLLDRPAALELMLARFPELRAVRVGAHQATLLQLAIEHDRPEIVAVCLARGVDPQWRDGSFGGTALGWAEHFGRPHLARLIADA